MSTAVIVGGVMLLGMGMVASQLFRLKDWLERQPPPAPPEDEGPDAPASAQSPDPS
jgi:hypothetical protein